MDSTSSASAAGTYMDMQSPDTSGDGRPKQQKQQMNEEMVNGVGGICRERDI